MSLQKLPSRLNKQQVFLGFFLFVCFFLGGGGGRHLLPLVNVLPHPLEISNPAPPKQHTAAHYSIANSNFRYVLFAPLPTRQEGRYGVMATVSHHYSFRTYIHCSGLTFGEQKLLELIVLVKHCPLGNHGTKVRDVLAAGHRNPS